jgi:hypothetical protein
LFHRQLTAPHQANSHIVPIKVWKLVETTPLHHANMLNLYKTNFESRNQLLRLWMLFLSMILTGLAGLLPSHFLPPGETIFCDVLGYHTFGRQIQYGFLVNFCSIHFCDAPIMVKTTKEKCKSQSSSIATYERYQMVQVTSILL